MKLLSVIGYSAGILINVAAGFYLAFVIYGKDIPARTPIPSDITCFTDNGLKTHDDLLLKRVLQPVNPFPNTFCPPVEDCPEPEIVECEEEDCSEEFLKGFAECTAQNKMYN